MKITEKILAGLIVLGFLMKLFHLPGGSFFMVLFTSMLSFLYMTMSFALLNDIRLREIGKKGAFKGISSKRIVFSVLLGLALSIALSGLLYKIQFWPGANFMQIFGAGSLGIALGVLYGGAKDATFKKNNTFRIVPIAALALVLYFTPTSKMVGVFMPPGTEFLKEAYEKVEADPSDMDARRALDEAWERYHNRFNELPYEEESPELDQY